MCRVAESVDFTPGEGGGGGGEEAHYFRPRESNPLAEVGRKTYLPKYISQDLVRV